VTFGEIVVVGGGCYGTFYAGQLARAKREGKTDYRRVLVVDRNPACRAAAELGPAEDRALAVSAWDDFFDDFLSPSGRAAEPPGRPDAIVPSPLMPHLMYAWLMRRARSRWPGRVVETRPLPRGPGTPYDRSAPDGTRYVSFADWVCPTHCIEPATCPVTRAPRTWEMADAVADLTGRLGAAGPVLFHCEHQVYGVGMFLVTEVMAGDVLLEDAGTTGRPVDVIVGTVSGCHGALNLMHLGAV